MDAGYDRGMSDDEDPQEPAALVDLTTFGCGIRIDVRYARSDNFLGRPLYDQALVGPKARAPS